MVCVGGREGGGRGVCEGGGGVVCGVWCVCEQPGHRAKRR